MEVEELSYEELIKEKKRKKNEYQKIYRKSSDIILEKGKIRRKKYYDKTRTASILYSKNYRILHEEETKRSRKEFNLKLKISAFNKIGGPRCIICGDQNISHLTIDHIDSTGNLDKKNGLYSGKLYAAIVSRYYKNTENLRVLCYNHNCSRSRDYLDIPREKQNVYQRYRTKLWKEAFDFFGPCSCGISELRFLTMSHIHNDGGEQRRLGNHPRSGIGLIKRFRKLGWPQSIKEDFCLECWNCNCGRGKLY